MLLGRVARFHEYLYQTIISAVKKAKETKSKYKGKQQALIKVWLIYSCNLATLLLGCFHYHTLFFANFYHLNLDLCHVPYLIFSNSSGAYSYNTQKTASRAIIKAKHYKNALLSFDGIKKRLYLKTTKQEIRSCNLDGSGLTTMAISYVELYTVDGQNNLIYFFHSNLDKVHIYHITSAQTSVVEALSKVNGVKDVEMDTING